MDSIERYTWGKNKDIIHRNEGIKYNSITK